MRIQVQIALVCTALAAPALAARRAQAKELPANTLSAAEKKQGWRLLFDGKTTTGWRGYKKPDAPPAWRVEDGKLILDGKGGDLITVDQFESFELTLEWKIAEGGNSGLMFRVAETDKPPYFTGPELQIADPKNEDGHDPLVSSGSCYALYPVKKDVTRSAGQWNQVRLVVRGDHVEHHMNGLALTSYEIDSEDWKRRVAASKFGKMPGFGKHRRGHLDLQDHGNRVEFRNIKLRELE
jgi:hypothetical protein